MVGASEHVMTVELDDKTAQMLRLKAAARQMSLDQYLLLLLQTEDAPADNGDLSPADFEQLLDKLASALPALPTLPADFSRRDIYDEHD
jgi:hypothetical protein